MMRSSIFQLPLRRVLTPVVLICFLAYSDTVLADETPATAYDFRPHPETWLNTTPYGGGLIFNASDTDYFRINATSNGYHRVQITLNVANDGTFNPWVAIHLRNESGLYWKSLPSVSNGTSRTFDFLVFTNDDLFIGLQLDAIKSTGTDQVQYNLWWNQLPGATNDPCEYNDIEAAATDLTPYEGIYASTAYGGQPLQGRGGVSTDTDFFTLNPPSPAGRVRIEMPWDNTRGSISLYGYQSGTTWSNYGTTFKGVTHIDHTFASTNPLYLKVSGINYGTPYDLIWTQIPLPLVEDGLEDDDTQAEATDTAGWADQDVHEETGIWPTQTDQDWFQIPVAIPGNHLSITATFNHALGDIDLALRDTNGVLLASATSTSSPEVIAFTVASPASYYVQVYGEDKGNLYNLAWSAKPPPADLQISGVTITEQSGLLDGRVTAGDRIAIDPEVRNYGAQFGVASNVVGTLVSSSAFVTVTQAVGTHSNIPAQLARTIQDTNLLVATVSPACPGGYETDLEYLIAADNAATVTGMIHLTVEATEDSYEENDTPDTAYVLPKDTALSSISGSGTQADSDWYELAVTQAGWLHATCSFVHAYGDLSLTLFDAATNQLDASATSADTEAIATIAYPGTYYLLVSGPTNFSDYDLIWSMAEAEPPELVLVTNAIAGEGGNRADFDGEIDPGEFAVFSFTLENTGELRATNVVIRLAGGDAVTTIFTPFTVTGGTIEAGSTATWTGLTVGVDWTAANGSSHPFDLIATNRQYVWTNAWTLVVNGLQDDAYEYDSTYDLASDTPPESTWLSTVDGPGRQVDADYFRIEANNPSNRMYRARIDNTSLYFRLHDIYDSILAGGGVVGTNRVIEYAALNHDPVLLKVLGGAVDPDTGQSYDLYWETLPHYLDFASYRLEEIGNGNGLYDPGEQVRIFTTLTNLSALAYPSVPLVLTSSTSDITVTWGSVMTGPCDPGGTVSNGILGFIVEIGSNVTSSATYELLITCDQSNDVATTLSVPITISADEDGYEPNDTCGAAFSLPSNTWLSSISGPGVQGDVDYYIINVTSEYQYVHVTCTYTHAEGNISLTFMGDTSDSTTGVESLTRKAPGTPHCIVVEGDNLRNQYDLIWSVTPAAPADASIVDYGIASGDADGDGQVDPNEMIRIWTVITNSGELTAHGSVDIQTDDGQVTYNNFFGSDDFYIAGGGTASNEINGWFKPAPDYPVGQQVPLDAVILQYTPTVIKTQAIPFLVQGISDDQYETNGFSDMNFFPKATWLSTIGGSGVQKDYDPYPIIFTEQKFFFEVLCDYNKSAGSLDCSLSGAQGISTSSTPSGIRVTGYSGPIEALYSIVITGDNSGIQYDLYWTNCYYSIEYDTHLFDDDAAGNGNGIFEADETVYLYYSISNQSCTPITGLTGTLVYAHDEDPYLEIYEGERGYPEIPVDAARSNALPFIFHFATNAPPGHVVTTLVSVANPYGAYEGRYIVVTCEVPSASAFAPPGVLIDDDMNDASNGNGDGELNPWEQVEIDFCWTNIGTATAEGIEVSIISTSPSVTVIWDWRWYSNIAPGEVSCQAPDGPFLLNVGADPGNSIHIQATIESLTGSTQVFDLLLPVVLPTPAEFATPGMGVDDDNNAPSEGNDDGLLDPGESIELTFCFTNIGEATAGDIEAILSSTNDQVDIIWGLRYYPDVDGGESVCADYDSEGFLFEIFPSHSTSTPVHLRLDLSFEGGDDQVFEWWIPVSSAPLPTPVGLEVSGPASAYELADTYGYVSLLRYDDNSAMNVSTQAFWTNSNPLVQIFDDADSVHITSGIIFSNETTDLTAIYDGFADTVTVQLIDQPFPVAAYDFQNAAVGSPPTGWTSTAAWPNTWDCTAETNLTPTNIALLLQADGAGIFPVQVARSAFIPAYLYLEVYFRPVPLTGGAANDMRMRVDFSPDDTGFVFRRPLFSVRNNGELLDMNNQVIGQVSTNEWDRIDLLYLRRVVDVITMYWHNGELLTPSVTPQLQPLYEESLTHVLITSPKGNLWFDSLRLAVDPFEAILEGLQIENMLMTLEGVSIDWAAFPAVRYVMEIADQPGSTNWINQLSNESRVLGNISVTNPPTESQIIRFRTLLHP